MQSPQDDKLLQFLQAVVRTIDTHWPETPLLQAALSERDAQTLQELREFLDAEREIKHVGGLESVATADALWVYTELIRAAHDAENVTDTPGSMSNPGLLSDSALISFVASVIADARLPVARSAIAQLPLPVATALVADSIRNQSESGQMRIAQPSIFDEESIQVPIEVLVNCTTRGRNSSYVYGKADVSSSSLRAAFDAAEGTAPFDFACELLLCDGFDTAAVRTTVPSVVVLEALRRARHPQRNLEDDVLERLSDLACVAINAQGSASFRDLFTAAVSLWEDDQSRLGAFLNELAKFKLPAETKNFMLRRLASTDVADSDDIDAFTRFLSSCIVSNFIDVLRLLGRKTDVEALTEAAENVVNEWNKKATDSDRSLILAELRTPLRALGRAVSNGSDLFDSGLDDEETLVALCFAENLLFDAKASELESTQRLAELIGGNEWHRRSDDLGLKCINRLISIIDELRNSWDEDVSSDALESISGVLGDRLLQVLHEE